MINLLTFVNMCSLLITLVAINQRASKMANRPIDSLIPVPPLSSFPLLRKCLKNRDLKWQERVFSTFFPVFHFLAAGGQNPRNWKSGKKVEKEAGCHFKSLFFKDLRKTGKVETGGTGSRYSPPPCAIKPGKRRCSGGEVSKVSKLVGFYYAD